MLIFDLTALCIKFLKWEKSCIESLIATINGKGKAKIHHLNQKWMFCSVLMATTNGLYLSNFRDFCDFRPSDTLFLIKIGLFFLQRKKPEIFLTFSTHNQPPDSRVPKGISKINPVWPPLNIDLPNFWFCFSWNISDIASQLLFMLNFSSFGIFTQI